MFDVITFGSGALDIYALSKDFSVVKNKEFITKKGLCLSLGSKIDIEDIFFKVGGGGVNAAFTFKNQGFEVSWCGMVGKDFAGDKIIEEISSAGIDSAMVLKTDKKPTNQSVVLTAAGKERTILVFRGASGEMGVDDIPWNRLKARWLYLAPLSGNTAKALEKLVDYAKENNIKVALNPGNQQLSLSKEILKRIFSKISVLFLNQEEASLLTGISYQKEKEIFKKLDLMVPGICIMTKGSGGAVASDGEYIYSAPSIAGNIVDQTGAGDSFASGFLSCWLKKEDAGEALQFGIANSVANMKSWGAKEGLLETGEDFLRVKVKKVKL